MNRINISKLNKSTQSEIKNKRNERSVYVRKSGAGHKVIFVESNLIDLFYAQNKSAIASGEIMRVELPKVSNEYES